MPERWLVLPYPPSVNHYYRNVNGRTLISADGRRYRSTIASQLARLRVEAMTGPLHLEVEVRPPDRRRRDLDNVLKALLDALQHGGLYADDSQFNDIRIWRAEPIADGCVAVRCMKEG